MNSKRPATISIKNLAAAVERAGKAVAEKNKVQFASGFIMRPTISGRQIRPVTEIAHAEKVASALTQEVAGSVGLAGAEPAVLIAGGHIICGFISPEAVTFEE
jgi:hypothetical protein